jgi:hypothetical protein
MKSEIIERLGQADILLPARIAEGLSANEKVKARLSVLQAAARHAHNPQAVPFAMTKECQSAGLDADAMERLVGAANLTDGKVTTPGLDGLVAGIWDDVAAMANAVKAGDAETGIAAIETVEKLKGVPPAVPDTIELAQIAQLTAVRDEPGETLHRVVMDLHKALNQLSAQHAEEIVAGAHAYGLLPQDRPAIAAFMRGIESTYKLKFNHPGLATTATRAGARLTIENDIGETTAHVIVIAVEESVVTLTYTDVHRARTMFFINRFRNFPVEWSGLDRMPAAGLGDEDIFYLVTGRYAAEGAKARDEFLEALGAALVFLIDWNKARKILRNWVSNGDAANILDWAARDRVGHRAFIELGGAELIASSVQHATPARIGFGDRLDHVLGRTAAVDFLKNVLRISAQALLQGGSVRLARDQIETDLVRRLQRLDGLLFTIIMRQAGLAREIAADIAQLIADEQAGRSFDREALAARARRIEEKADRIAIEARGEIARFGADPIMERLVNEVEQATDELEQAAFIASLAPSKLSPDLLSSLADLCSAAIAAVEATVMGATAAAAVPDGHRADSDDALLAIDRLIKAEHDGDAAERAITAAVLRGNFPLQLTLAAIELARALERATDRLAAFGHHLRRHVLADLSA